MANLVSEFIALARSRDIPDEYIPKYAGVGNFSTLLRWERGQTEPQHWARRLMQAYVNSPDNPTSPGALEKEAVDSDAAESILFLIRSQNKATRATIFDALSLVMRKRNPK